jgi:hypothetical protein
MNSTYLLLITFLIGIVTPASAQNKMVARNLPEKLIGEKVGLEVQEYNKQYSIFSNQQAMNIQYSLLNIEC